MKKRYLISLLIGLACLYLAFRKVDWGEILAAFRRADYAPLPLFVAAHLAGVLIRVSRWKLLLGPVKRARFRNLLSALSVGFMANFIFPARAGEVIRAYLIGRREGISASASFATVVLERLFDGFAILTFLVLAPFFLTLPHGEEEARVMSGIKTAGLMALAAYLIIAAFLFFFSRRPTALAVFTELLCRPLPARFASTIRHMAGSFGRGLEILGNPLHILAIMAWSLALWFIQGMANNAVLHAFGLKLPFFAGLLLLVFQSFGVMVPSPGFVGAFQGVHVLGLFLFGVSRESALSVGILIHGLLFLVYLSLGVLFLWVEGMGLGEVKSVSGEDRLEKP